MTSQHSRVSLAQPVYWWGILGVNGLPRLSEFQQHLLRWTLARYRRIEDQGDDYAKSILKVWGVAIRRLANGTSRSESASISRAIRMLEWRGFIRRRNDISGDPWNSERDEVGRTTHIQFTESGRELAERLDALALPGEEMS